MVSGSFFGSFRFARTGKDEPLPTKRVGDRLFHVLLDESFRGFNRFCEVRRRAHPIGEGSHLRLQDFRRIQAYTFQRLQAARRSEGVEIDDRQRVRLEVATTAQLLSEKDRLPVIDAEEDDIRTRKNLGDAGLAVGLHANPSPVSDGLSQELDLSSVLVPTVQQCQPGARHIESFGERS
mgnify:CR=1 FL=1